MSSNQDYRSFGIERGTEILRYQHLDRSLSGILFKFDGGLLTARHVVEAHNLQGFRSHAGSHMDLAYHLDEIYKGLKLGYVDKFTLDNVEILTSSIDSPDELVIIPGSTGFHFLPTFLRPFHPSDPESASEYFKPGVSGSPLIYKEHIVGLIPFKNLNNPYEVEAVVFNGPAMKEAMEEFGLTLEKIE